MIRFFVRILFLLSSILTIPRLIHGFSRFSRIQKRKISLLMVCGRLLIRVSYSVLRLLAFSKHHESVPIFSHSSKINNRSENGSSLIRILWIKAVLMLPHSHVSIMILLLQSISHSSSRALKVCENLSFRWSEHKKSSIIMSRNMDFLLSPWNLILRA